MKQDLKIENTALLIIDLQKGILNMPTVPYSSKEIVENSSQLVDYFRSQKAFIAFIRVNFHDGLDKLSPNAMMELPVKNPNEDFISFADELHVTDSDYIVDKRGFSGFFGTDLDLQLRRRGIKNLVLCDISTHAAVDSTARDAYQYNYNQYFITDAMGAMTQEANDFPINNIFPIMGQTLKADEYLKIINSKSN